MSTSTNTRRCQGESNPRCWCSWSSFGHLGCPNIITITEIRKLFSLRGGTQLILMLVPTSRAQRLGHATPATLSDAARRAFRSLGKPKFASVRTKNAARSQQECPGAVRPRDLQRAAVHPTS